MQLLHNDFNVIIVVREDKALVCYQPRQRGRGRTTFKPRGSAHTQRGIPNSFQPRRVSLNRFASFPRRGLRFAAFSLYRRVRVNLTGSHSTRNSERSPHTVYCRSQRYTYQYGSWLRFMLFSSQFRLVEPLRSTSASPRSDSQRILTKYHTSSMYLANDE